MSTVIENYSGKKLNLRFPYPADIVIGDIAKQLSRICRFNGACRWFYSVAQHSVHCVEYAKAIGITETALLAHILVHDAHEAYFGDITSPTQELLEGIAPGAINALKTRIQNAIIVRCELPALTPEGQATVDHVDRALRTIEASTLMVSRGADWEVRETPRAYVEIDRYDADSEAENFFMSRFGELLPRFTVDPPEGLMLNMRDRLRLLQERIEFPKPIKPERVLQDQGADVELDR